MCRGQCSEEAAELVNNTQQRKLEQNATPALRRHSRPVRWWPVYRVPSFLPGRLVLCRGTRRDYEELERFHYRPKRPATWAEVWTVRYETEGLAIGPQPSRPVAVAVLSYPTLAHFGRERALRLSRLDPKQRIRFVNKHVRTISRVAVHPTFRAVGLAGLLVRCLLHRCTTRYTEAMAVMGRAHPFFERAGMKRVSQADTQPDRPVYYLYDRKRQGEMPWRLPILDFQLLIGDRPRRRRPAITESAPACRTSQAS